MYHIGYTTPSCSTGRSQALNTTCWLMQSLQIAEATTTAFQEQWLLFCIPSVFPFLARFHHGYNSSIFCELAVITSHFQANKLDYSEERIMRLWVMIGCSWSFKLNMIGYIWPSWVFDFTPVADCSFSRWYILPDEPECRRTAISCQAVRHGGVIPSERRSALAPPAQSCTVCWTVPPEAVSHGV